MKKTFAIASLFISAFLLSGCSHLLKPSIEAIDVDDFDDVLSEMYDSSFGDHEQYREVDYCGYINRDWYNSYRIYVFDDEDDAYDYYDDLLDDIEDDIDDEHFDGKYDIVEGKDYGYIVFDGEYDGDGDSTVLDDVLSSDSNYAYGGLFYADDMVMFAICREDDDDDIEEINDFLKEIGYPTP